MYSFPAAWTVGVEVIGSPSWMQFELSCMSSRYGKPEYVRCGNGPEFSSLTLRLFLQTLLPLLRSAERTECVHGPFQLPLARLGLRVLTPVRFKGSFAVHYEAAQLWF